MDLPATFKVGDLTFFRDPSNENKSICKIDEKFYFEITLITIEENDVVKFVAFLSAPQVGGNPIKGDPFYTSEMAVLNVIDIFSDRFEGMVNFIKYSFGERYFSPPPLPYLIE